MTGLKKFVGDKAFYRMILAIAIPIILQNGVSNFVNLLDNLMVGQMGTEQINGVAIANQLVFVFNIFIFGAISGSSIFSTQFVGSKDYESVRCILRLKLYIALLVSVLCITVFAVFSVPLLSLYMAEGGTKAGDPVLTLNQGRTYLLVMLLGLIPYSISQAFASSLRESDETLLPMKASIAAVFVNLIFNYLLIFGHFGFPCWGVAGAAAATVLSRFVELGIILIGMQRRKAKFPYLMHPFTTLKIPFSLLKKVMVKGTPLMFNELLWSLGITAQNQAFASRGLAVMGGINISSTVGNLFNVVYLSMGTVVGIVVGQRLGAGEKETAVDYNRKLTIFSIGICMVIGALMLIAAPFVPQLYNTETVVRELASCFIMWSAIIMPLRAFLHCAYFTIRTGGRTVITFLLDGFYVCCIPMVLARILVNFTDLDVKTIFALVTCSDVIKGIICYVLVKSRIWVVNLAGNAGKKEEAQA